VRDTPTPGAAGERFAAQRSHLPWPVSGQLRARFGTARESGRTRWEGVVIAARPGSTVRSIHAGKVVYADVLGGYGLLVIVDHGEGYLSLYGYNDAVLKRVGQRVQGGEPIASVGDRGGASGVYFEIRYRGQPVNPSVWCGG
jgi:septal ring factor EnvC (AmiA/AmiB activator)